MAGLYSLGIVVTTALENTSPASSIIRTHGRFSFLATSAHPHPWDGGVLCLGRGDVHRSALGACPLVGAGVHHGGRADLGGGPGLRPCGRCTVGACPHAGLRVVLACRGPACRAAHTPCPWPVPRAGHTCGHAARLPAVCPCGLGSRPARSRLSAPSAICAERAAHVVPPVLIFHVRVGAPLSGRSARVVEVFL